MSDRSPPAYTIVVAEPGEIAPSVNYSSVSPPRPQDLVCPPGRESATFWVVGTGTVVGIVDTWLHANNVTQGMSGQGAQKAKGWATAVDTYRRAYETRSVHITGAPALNVQSPITVTSSPAPCATLSYFSTPSRHGGPQNPVLVNSSPVAFSPGPHSASRNSRTNQMPQYGSTPLVPATRTTPVLGSRNYPLSVQSSPLSTIGQRSHTPALSSHSEHITPAPVTPRPRITQTAFDACLRAIEDTIEHYGARNDCEVPLPLTPTSQLDDEVRLAALEECLKELLTREAQRLSARTTGYAEHRDILTAMFESARTHFWAQHAPDGRDDISDPAASPSVPQHAGDGRNPTPSGSPVAGLSTGPGTALAAAATMSGAPSSQEINYFAGFREIEFTPKELKRLDKLLDST